MNNGYQASQFIPSNNSSQSYYIPSGYQGSYQGNDERLVGGFAFPFLLGGVTGAALAPSFWGPGYGYNRPPYYYPPRPRPYPYPPRRWF